MEEKIKSFNILIISGGDVDYHWAKEWLKNQEFAYVIAADRGLMHAKELKLTVNYILGDYDSVDQDVLEEYRKDTKVVTYPPEKNYTDTHLALLHAISILKEAVNNHQCSKEQSKIILLGATGNRYDHTLTNICNMKAALEDNIPCYIYDAHNKIYLSNTPFYIRKAKQYGNYLSFVPMSENVLITLHGVKYPLRNYELKQGLSICQSNEIVGEKAYIGINQGIVVTFETIER